MPFDSLRRHPEFEAWHDVAALLWPAYVGGKAYRDAGMLDQYPRELAVIHEARKQRAYYVNLFAAVVDAYVSAVYKRDPVRESAEMDEMVLPDAPSVSVSDPEPVEVELAPAMTQFMEDATGAGHSLTRFVREAVTFGLATERAFVVVDVNARGLPYCHRLHPDNLLDFSRDDDGRMRWAIVAESHVEDSDPMLPREESRRYRLWTPEEWVLFDEDAVELDSERNRAGRVPIVEVDGTEVNLPVYDIALIVRRIYNLCSQLDEILVNVTFPQMYASGDAVEDAAGGSISDDTAPIAVGTSRLLLIPQPDQGSPMAPGFLAPPDGPARLHMEERENLIAAIYSLAGLERRDPDSQKAQSGVAKAYDFRETNARLVSLAQTAERAEEEIFDLVNAYGVPGGVNVSYAKDFNVKDFAAMLESYLQIQEATLPVPVKKRAALDLSMAIAEEATEEEKREIREAVEAMDDAEFGGSQPDPLEAILGRPPAAPPFGANGEGVPRP